MCWRHTPCVCCAETPLGGGGGACQMASGGLRYHRPNHFWQARCFINIWLSMKELEQEGGAEAAQPSKNCRSTSGAAPGVGGAQAQLAHPSLDVDHVHVL